MNLQKYILILITTLLIGCSTTRNNFFSRNYHQTTTKYNGFFNAKESMKKGLEKNLNSYSENYQNIIPINPLFNIYNSEEPKDAYPNFDRVIEKTVKVIRKHSMEIGEKEINKWIDDNYFLMAQARFYKQDYQAAINTFNYIIRKYPKSKLSNKSLIWSTKAHIKLNNLQTAEKNLNFLLVESNLSSNDQRLLYELLAEYHILNKDYSKGITAINDSFNGKEKRETKIRKHFILGQLYQLVEKGDSAIFHYDKVISMNPEYEMTFRSYLNKAQAFAYSKNEPEELLKDYQKMLKDDKNNEYRDQIFYAISEIYLNQTDTVLAVENLNNSINSFLFDLEQKQQSHLRLAEIYFDQRDYSNSFLQYDSVMNIINSEGENFLIIKRKHRQLKEVSNYENTIITQDSLLNLASLPESERNQIIDNYIKELKQKEELERQLMNSERGGNNFNLYEYNRNQNQGPNTAAGGWYFYNPSAMSFGYSEFLGRWGNRKLEDNWRRKNKNSINLEEEVVDEEDGPTEKEKYDRQYYIDQLPTSEEAQKESLDLIENSYYKLGLALKDYFSDYFGMIDCHNEMFDKFPETDFKLLILIHHMLAYQTLEMQQDFQRTLSLIFLEFPDNSYIDKNGVLLPPKGGVEISPYERVYNLFNLQKHEETLLLLDELNYQNNPNISKEEILNLRMIEAFCSAVLSGKKSYVEYLEAIVADYPETEVSSKAQLFLDVLYGSFYETDQDLYLTDFSQEHHIIISIEDLSIDMPKAQSIITNFNNTFYLEKELQVNNLLLNKETQILKVAKFDNKNLAMDYFFEMNEYEDWLIFSENKKINVMAISNPNFIKLFKQKDLNTYQSYFLEKYLNY